MTRRPLRAPTTPLLPMIVVDHASALIDQAVALELRGYAAGQPVTLTASIQFADGTRWQSHATFVTDESGCADLTRQAPLSGTYEGVAAMGFMWSAERQPGDVHPFPEGIVMRPWLVELEARASDGTGSRFTLERRGAGIGVTREPIRRDGIVGTLFLPSDPGPHPAVMVVSGGGGGISEGRAAILASHGYAALALGYFGVEGLPRGLVNIPLEYFERAIHWMRAQPWLGDRLLAVWGPSRGGELALLLGATFPDINAVIAWVPSGVVFWPLGKPEPGDTRPPAAWTYRGQPLPYLQEGNSSSDPPPVAERGKPVAYAPFYRGFLRDARAVERATIAVEKTRGPILLVSGSDDQMWPSSDLADIALRRLQAHRHPFPYRHLKYEGAGHLISVPYGPTTVRDIGLPVEGFAGYLYHQGGSTKADAEAGIDAWRRTLEFLEEAVAERERTRASRPGAPGSGR